MSSIYNSTIQPACVLVVFLWVMGVSVIIYDRFLSSDDVGFIGMVFVVLGVTVQIRGYYLSVCRRLDDAQLDSEIRQLREVRSSR